METEDSKRDAGPGDESAEAAAEGPAGEPTPAEALATLEADLANVRDRWMRAEAEIQNVRRRATREREDLRREVDEQWLVEAAGLLEDLERGIQSAREGGAPETWTRGFELVRQRIGELLQRYGVEVLNPVGEIFDPHRHEAMLELEAPAGETPGTVLQVMSRGLARHGRPLRAAKVVVARAAAPSGD